MLISVCAVLKIFNSQHWFLPESREWVTKTDQVAFGEVSFCATNSYWIRVTRAPEGFGDPAPLSFVVHKSFCLKKFLLKCTAQEPHLAPSDSLVRVGVSNLSNKQLGWSTFVWQTPLETEGSRCTNDLGLSKTRFGVQKVTKLQLVGGAIKLLFCKAFTKLHGWSSRVTWT